MRPLFISVISVFASLLAIDGIWLSIMTSRFYMPRIGHLLAPSPSLLPAALFYVLYIAGVIFFVVSPALQNGAGLGRVFLTGALLGLFAYGTYDLTNQATLREWPVAVTVVDLLWGSFLTGSVGAIAVFLARSLSS